MTRIVLVEPARSVEGVVYAPPSKSHTHRAFFVASLVDGVSRILNPLWCDDTLATLRLVESLGASINAGDDYVEVFGGLRLPEEPVIVDCGESGTTIRIGAGIAGLTDKPVLLYGSGRIDERPIRGLLEALRVLGVEATSLHGCCPPVLVKGPMRSGSVVVDAGESSQYLSALLIAGSALDNGLEVLVENVSSRGYVDITVSVLDAFRVRVERIDYKWFRVHGPPRPVEYRVPGDWSSVAPLLALGAIKGRVRVVGVSLKDEHPDKSMVGLLEAVGAKVSTGEDWVEATSTSRLDPLDVCIDDYPDLALVATVLASMACGVSRICCIERLKLKESDRVKAILDLLRVFGIDARLEGECILVRGACGEELEAKNTTVQVSRDHRVVMAAALLALASKKPVKIANADAVNKSYPDFWNTLQRLGVSIKTR